MEHCEQTDLASLYAVGLLEGGESAAFADHLRSCASCEEAVRRSAELAVALAEAKPLLSPPSSLRNRVLAEVPLPRGVAALVRSPQVQWQPTGYDGVFIATLYEDSVRRETASLLRLSPGAFYPAHHHSDVEHCYVLQGDLVFSDHTLNAGDYEAAQGGADHPPVTSKTGCLLFLIHHLDDQVYSQ